MKNDIETVSGSAIPQLQFEFQISKVDLNKKILTNSKLYKNFLVNEFHIGINKLQKTNNNSQPKLNSKSYLIQKDNLPNNFVPLNIDSVNNPSSGCIFYTPFGFPGWKPTYLIISDDYGTPIFYRKTEGATFDFKKLNNGNLAYFELGPNKYYMMDSSYNVIDSLYMQNGYVTDLHDVVVLKNKHSLLLSYDYEHVAMDTVVEGGDSNATVIGIILQELDENKNVVFQWRSWDHFKITDATYDIT